MLTKAMTYVRTDTPDFSTRLTREELRVFTAVQGETGVAAIVTKTRLAAAQVEDAVAKLVARRLLRPADSNTTQPQIGAPPPRTVAAWTRQREAAVGFLQSRVGGDKAEIYSAQLRDCDSEGAYADILRALARRIALVVDVGVAKELLTFLDPDGEPVR